MIEKNKQLLLQDLCSRLPYKVQVCYRKPFGCVVSEEECELTSDIVQEFMSNEEMVVYPYLRPMTNMTDEEKYEIYVLTDFYGEVDVDGDISTVNHGFISHETMGKYIDYLVKHHFDYHHLLEKGLAIEAFKGMYNEKEK